MHVFATRESLYKGSRLTTLSILFLDLNLVDLFENPGCIFEKYEWNLKIGVPLTTIHQFFVSLRTLDQIQITVKQL